MIREVQRRNQLPETGVADVATLSAMGFSGDIAVRMASALANTRVGTRLGPVTQLSMPLIVAGLAASGFLGYAVWTYTKKRR
jgi:hypothetical protein